MCNLMQFLSWMILPGDHVEHWVTRQQLSLMFGDLSQSGFLPTLSQGSMSWRGKGGKLYSTALDPHFQLGISFEAL